MPESIPPQIPMNSPILTPCPRCDYKGTVRTEVKPGLTQRRPCPHCQGKRLLILEGCTYGSLVQIAQENHQLKADVMRLRTELVGLIGMPTLFGGEE